MIVLGGHGVPRCFVRICITTSFTSVSLSNKFFSDAMEVGLPLFHPFFRFGVIVQSFEQITNQRTEEQEQRTGGTMRNQSVEAWFSPGNAHVFSTVIPCFAVVLGGLVFLLPVWMKQSPFGSPSLSEPYSTTIKKQWHIMTHHYADLSVQHKALKRPGVATSMM